MKPPETLLDAIYRLTFNPKTNKGWRSNHDMQRALKSAHRFVADEPMARFMAELANEAFIRNKNKIGVRICDSLRVQSRLPYEAVWIEYPLRAYQAHSTAIRGTPEVNTPDLQPIREGWLIQQHPRIDSAAIMHLFTMDPEPDWNGDNYWTFPFAFAWCCDDIPMPWHRLVMPETGKGRYASELFVGVKNYRTDLCAIVESPLIADPDPRNLKAYEFLLSEWTGILRRVWSLLATIGNLPVTYGETRTAKGFLARGRIRQGLTHKTVTLTIPGRKDTRVLARKVIAQAHRKRHDVRSHWRDDWRHPPSERCNPHIWECLDNDADLIECEVCRGRQIYIHAHERGDEALGWVKHRYELRHNT